jgi:hypothetical protein
MHSPFRLIRLLAGGTAALLLTVTSAAASTAHNTNTLVTMSPAVPAGDGLLTVVAAAEPPDISGIWEGSSQAYCGAGTAASRCNAVQKITLDLRQEGNTIKGSYKCAYGNLVCRNLNTTGKIVSGDYRPPNAMIRILMPDASTCRFTGRFESKGGSGAYVCYYGSKPVERGMWRVSRGM